MPRKRKARTSTHHAGSDEDTLTSCGRHWFHLYRITDDWEKVDCEQCKRTRGKYGKNSLDTHRKAVKKES